MRRATLGDYVKCKEDGPWHGLDGYGPFTACGLGARYKAWTAVTDKPSGLVCKTCLKVKGRDTVTRREVSFNTMCVHFAPRIDEYTAAGEHLYERGIVGQLAIDCCHMPDKLRAEVEQWVRTAYLRRGQ